MGVKVRQKAKGKDNPWWVFISYKGKRTSRKIGSKSSAKKVAEKIEAKLKLDEFNFEPDRKPRVPTFKAYAEGFMDTYSAMNHKPSTQKSYRDALDGYLLDFFGDTPLDQIGRKDIKAFLAGLQSKGLEPGTVRNYKAYLSKILTEAVDDEIIDANPAARTGKMIRKKDITEDVNPFTWEEKATFENTVKDHYPKQYAFFLTALRTGMRLGELIALKTEDLDFEGRFIEVRRSHTKGHHGRPKSNRIRRVDMSNQLVDVLRAHITQSKKDALKNGWGEPPEWLFYNGDGKVIDPDNFRRRVFYKVLKKAGLRRIRIHDLRHTYATLRLNKGDNIVDVSKQLGHADVKITLDVYTHWIPGSKKAQVDELDLDAAPECTLYAPEAEKQIKKDLSYDA